MVSTVKIALKALRRILEKNWVLEDALTRDERIDMLTDADKALLRETVFTVLRRMGEIDRFINEYTKLVDDGLRVGVAQAVLMGQDPKLVAKQVIAEAENKKDESLYSAVLNRLHHKKFAADSRLNYPKWMAGSWRKAYGEENTAKIMEAMLADVPEGYKKPALPKADVVVEAVNSETGLVALKPEVIHQRHIEEVTELAKGQKMALDEAYGKIGAGKLCLYVNNSLQYEEGEGLVKKLDAAKWQVVEQKRLLPFEPEAGGIGWFWVVLKKIA